MPQPHFLKRVLTIPVVTVLPHTSVSSAVSQMVRNEVDTVVVEAQGILQGIFTSGDFVKRVYGAGKNPEEICIGNVMTRNVTTIPITASIEEAEKAMSTSLFHILPVVDKKGSVLALISALDLLRERIRELDREAECLSALASVGGIGGD